MSNSINKHISEINSVKRQLLSFADELKDQKLRTLLNNKTDNYLTIFKEAFSEEEKAIKKDMEYFADVRSLAKYNENLITGWLVEDFYFYIFTLPIFKKHGFSVSIDSHDADRVIKKVREKINSNPDFTIKYKDISFGLEIQSLFTNIDHFHIKENKANKAMKNTSFIYSLILPRLETVYFFPFSIKKNGVLEEVAAWGGKLAYKFNINELPAKRKIGKKGFVNNFIMTFYLFTYYKRYGKSKFFKFSESCRGISRKDIIQKVFNELK